MIISICTKKVFDRIQHLFIIKKKRKLGIEGNIFNLMKTTYINFYTNTIFNGDQFKAFPQVSDKR